MNILGVLLVITLLVVVSFMSIIAMRVVSRGRCLGCGEYKGACACVDGENYFRR